MDTTPRPLRITPAFARACRDFLTCAEILTADLLPEPPPGPPPPPETAPSRPPPSFPPASPASAPPGTPAGTHASSPEPGPPSTHPASAFTMPSLFHVEHPSSSQPTISVTPPT